jgi:hypothetical protein
MTAARTQITLPLFQKRVKLPHYSKGREVEERAHFEEQAKR